MLNKAKDIIAGWPEDRGRPMMGATGAALLMECVAETDGDYIEIGSAFGGSAIFAATAMGDRPGMVFCIDNFLAVNELDRTDVVFLSFWEAMYHFGVQQRVIAFNQSHPPFPTAIHHHKFSVGLVDGNHLGVAPMLDFMGLDSRVTDYILFDNAELSAVSEAVKSAIDGGDWKKHKSITYISTLGKEEQKKKVKLVVVKRVDDKVPEEFYAKTQHYWGLYRLPLQ